MAAAAAGAMRERRALMSANSDPTKNPLASTSRSAAPTFVRFHSREDSVTASAVS